MKLIVDSTDIRNVISSLYEYIEAYGLDSNSIYPLREAGFTCETELIKTAAIELIRDLYGMQSEDRYIRLSSVYNLKRMVRYAHRDAVDTLKLPHYSTKPNNVSMAGTKLIIIWEV